MRISLQITTLTILAHIWSPTMPSKALSIKTTSDTMKGFIAILRRYTLAMAMNFVGLVLAFTAFMTIMTQVEHQKGFDRHYPSTGRIYRVDKAGAAKDDIFRNILPRGYADDIIGSSPHIVAGSIDCPYVGELALNTAPEDGKHVFRHRCNIVYPGFFEIFGVRFVEGSAEALNDLQQIAIPQSLSRMLYGDGSAVGKVLIHHEHYKLGTFRAPELVIGAVYEDLPSNSQFNNDIYMHPGNVQEGSYGGANMICWLLLDSPDSKRLVEDNFNQNFDYGNDTWLTDIDLTPIEDIYFNDREGKVFKTGSVRQIWLMVFISILIMLVGGINYATFFTALAPMRVRSINTQKVLGSPLGSLCMALLTESAAFSICALLLALCIASPATEFLMSHAVISTSFSITANKTVAALSAAIALMVGVIAGAYPSIYVTSLSAAFALKGNFGLSAGGRRFRTGMMLIQYVISTILIIFAIFIHRQNRFMMNYENGFEKENMVVFQLSQRHVLDKSDWLVERLRSLPEVDDVAFSMELMGGYDEYCTSTMEYNGENVRFYVLYCSPNFLDVMRIPVVEGRGFEKSDAGYLIINPKMKEYGAKIEDNTEAGGIIGQTGPVRINSLRRDEAPFCYMTLPKEYGLMEWTYVRLHEGCDKTAAMDKIEEALAEMDPEHLFELRFYDEVTGELYATETSQSSIISLFSMLAAVLSLIGIFGQALLDVQYRRRDIAIKKVYGADASRVLKEGLRKYAIITSVAFVIAAPAAWFAVVRWLESFVKKVPTDIWPFAAAYALILVLTLSIAALQYVKAAHSDPSETLKTE